MQILTAVFRSSGESSNSVPMSESASAETSQNYWPMPCTKNGRVRQTVPLLQEGNAQPGRHRKGRVSRLARQRMLLNQANRFGPRHHQIHLTQKLAPARALGHKVKSGGGKVYMFHQHITSGRLSGWLMQRFPSVYFTTKPRSHDGSEQPALNRAISLGIQCLRVKSLFSHIKSLPSKER